MSRVNEKVERGSTFYVHVQPSIFCLYFIYVRTHVKITRQWKSTFIVRGVKCYWLIDENILGQVFGIPADFAGANDITNLPGKTRDAGTGIVIGRSHSVILFSHITSCISLSTPFPCLTVWFMIWFLFVSYLTVFLHFFFFCTASTAKQDAEDGPNISCPASRNESWAINWGPGAVFRTSLPVLVSLTDLTAYPFMNPKYHWRHINTNEKNRSVITKRYQKGHIQESA